MMMMVSVNDRVMAKCWILYTFLFTVILGFEHETYSTGEGNSSIEVCIRVKSGILQSSLRLSLTTVDGSATGEQD